MKKWISCLAIAALSTLPLMTNAADDAQWQGRLFNITPRNEKTTMEYCKAHVPDTYTTTKDQVDKEIKADNGVIAKDLHFKVRDEGGVFFGEGSAMFSGEFEGKTFSEKAHFYAVALGKDTMRHGVWYTDHCKGEYEVGPKH